MSGKRKPLLLLLIAFGFLFSAVPPAGAPPLGARFVPHPTELPRFRGPEFETHPPMGRAPGHSLDELFPGFRGLTDQPQAESKPPSEWKSWSDLPHHIRSEGVLLSRTQFSESFGPQNFPGIVFRRPKVGEPTGPPRSLELLAAEKEVPLPEAVRALLIGPDGKVFSQYKKSPEGRYLLDLPESQYYPAGKYQIRLLLDATDTPIVVRRISLDVKEDQSIGQGNRSHLDVYVSREKLSPQDGSVIPAEQRTTFETNSTGEKFLRDRIEELDRALIYNEKAYKTLDPSSSYELKWRTMLNYAKSLHDVSIWHHYDSAQGARRLFTEILEEFRLSQKKWFWQPKLTDFGIKESDIVEPLRNLEAMGVQEDYVQFFREGRDNIMTLLRSLNGIREKLDVDEGAYESRLQLTRQKFGEDTHSTRETLRKLYQPALIELDNGDYALKTISVPDELRTYVEPRNGVDDLFEDLRVLNGDYK